MLNSHSTNSSVRCIVAECYSETTRGRDGQFARRIVCWVRPGDVLARGEMYGMIKLGSRTELVIPDSEALEIVATIGDTVYAGSSTLARYRQVT